MALLLPIVAAGCAHPARVPFEVAVRAAGPSCTIVAGGRTVALDDLRAIAQREAGAGRRARIVAETAGTPYRCVGGALYTLQTAGFGDVEVTGSSSPAP